MQYVSFCCCTQPSIYSSKTVRISFFFFSICIYSLCKHSFLLLKQNRIIDHQSIQHLKIYLSKHFKTHKILQSHLIQGDPKIKYTGGDLSFNPARAPTLTGLKTQTNNVKLLNTFDCFLLLWKKYKYEESKAVYRIYFQSQK